MSAVCLTQGCGRVAIRLKKTLCYGCYMRLYRKGTTDYHAPAELRLQSAGYLVQRAPGHSLTKKRRGNYEYQHRVVFYDRHGEGPFSCHWCDEVVSWDTMHVDHKDEDITNNDPDNLVPSCARCNLWRNYQKTRTAITAATGVFLTAFGRTQCISQWAREVGISNVALKTRLTNGWSLERALSEPRGKFGPPSKPRQETKPNGVYTNEPKSDGTPEVR